MGWIHGALGMLGAVIFALVFVSGLQEGGGGGYVVVGAGLALFINGQLRRQFRRDHPARDPDEWTP